MALPIPSGLPVPPKKNIAQDEREEISLPGLPVPPPRAAQKPRPQNSGLPKSGYTRDERSPLHPEIDVKVDKDARSEWKVDPKTGIRHRVLPKTEYDENGNPVLQIDDFDADDLNAEANEFLAHLRVAPSKEEKIEARRAREERLKSRS